MKNSLLFSLLLFALLTCSKEKKDTRSYLVFTGATIIDGTGLGPIADGVLVTSGGKVVATGTKKSLPIPEGAEVRDVSGKFIMPGLINTHGHVGDVKGIEGGHYSRENIINNLFLYARYGVTTVISLGGDKADAESLRR